MLISQDIIDVVLKYLQKFAVKNNLDQNCSFSCEAERVQKLNGKFRTNGTDGNLYVTDRIVINWTNW